MLGNERQVYTGRHMGSSLKTHCVGRGGILEPEDQGLSQRCRFGLIS